MLFYRPGEDHGLPRDPFNSIVVPRPIGWISTRSRDGVDNLAPYSFFNAVAYSPPQVMFAATSAHSFGGLKDSVRNALDTGQFVVNLDSEDGDDNTVVFGRVVGVHLDETVPTEGRVDMAKLQPIGRLGSRDYVAVREVFARERPTWEGRDGT